MDLQWKPLDSEEVRSKLRTESFSRPVLVFKHSTRCSVSVMAKSRMDSDKQWPDLSYYYLDVLSFRAISNALAEEYHVHHESPQVLLIHQGSCAYDESHIAIQPKEIQAELASYSV
jgi:bacillithiol system protein YtxJ